MNDAIDEDDVLFQLNDQAIEALEEAALVVLNAAKANIRSRSGKLIASGYIEIDEGSDLTEPRARIGFREFYMKFIEFGFVHPGGKNVAPRAPLRRALVENREKVDAILARVGEI